MIQNTFRKLYDSSPREAVAAAKDRLQRRSLESAVLKTKAGIDAMATVLRERFAIYRTLNLKAIDAQAFRKYIESQIGAEDAEGEGYSEQELDRQRDRSITFHWGHDHDFLDFSVRGRMHERHFKLLATLSRYSQSIPMTLKTRRCLTSVAGPAARHYYPPLYAQGYSPLRK
ncbi:MAG: hypothetical protein OEQ39_17835 [Gammaproteobacteria bacterium]|nr:hypothetical protein [Gammaproteobacteria bacterium]